MESTDNGFKLEPEHTKALQPIDENLLNTQSTTQNLNEPSTYEKENKHEEKALDHTQCLADKTFSSSPLVGSGENISYEDKMLLGAPGKLYSFPSLQENLNGQYYKLPSSDKQRWTTISNMLEALCQDKPSIEKVLETIESLNYILSGDKYNTLLLRRFFESAADEERKHYEEQVLPKILRFVINTPSIFYSELKIPILFQGERSSVSISREECACLLANMFMCTTIDQYNPKLPRRFNFSELYSSQGDPSRDQVKVQKIQCLLNYFKNLSSYPSMEQVTFHRLVYSQYIYGRCDLGSWKNCDKVLRDVKIESGTKIEDTPYATEVDFANKYLGGGVLGNGAVQEEIQFITRPEQIVGILFCECMENTEAILIKGAKVASEYRGYASNFTFKKEGSEYYSDPVTDREVIAIDAVDYSRKPYTDQFSDQNLSRDLNKAYIGFCGANVQEGHFGGKAISTGNWGCGAFRGDLQLKFLLQWAAATRAGRDLVFHSSEVFWMNELGPIIEYYKGERVGKLVEDLHECARHIRNDSRNQIKIFYSLKKFKVAKYVPYL